MKDQHAKKVLNSYRNQIKYVKDKQKEVGFSISQKTQQYILGRLLAIFMNTNQANMDATFTVLENQLYLLILKFLKERGLYKSYIALETETKTSLVNYPYEFANLRKLILEGEFEESEQFLVPFMERFQQKMCPAMYEIKKQYFLELLEIGPDYQIMTRLLKSIQQYTTKENYKRLFFLLSVENINDHPEYLNWSPEKGRLECFEKVKNCIEEVCDFGQYEENLVQNNITTLIERLVNYEFKDKQKFDRIVNDCLSNNTNQISILDDSIIGQSANRHKLQFYLGQADKTTVFDNSKSANFPQQKQQQLGGQKTNAAQASQTASIQQKPFLSVLQKNVTKVENDNQQNSQQIQNEIRRNEIDFMELDESVLEESHQTEFLENYQNRHQQNRSMLKGQKLLASNNNPNMEGSSYYYGPGFVQSEHIGNNQQWDSNFYSQSMPPQQQVLGLKSAYQNNNYTTGKSQVVPHSQLVEQEKKLQNQHHLIKESNTQLLHNLHHNLLLLQNHQSQLQKQNQLQANNQSQNKFLIDQSLKNQAEGNRISALQSQQKQQQQQQQTFFDLQKQQQENLPEELLQIEMGVAKSSSVKCMRKQKLSFHHRNKFNHQESDIPFINFSNNIQQQQGSEEDQNSNNNQEEKEEEVEEEEVEEEEEEEVVDDDDEDEEEQDNEEEASQQQYYQNQGVYEQQNYQGDSKYYGYNQSDLLDDQSQVLQSKGRQFYGNDSNFDNEEKVKKSVNNKSQNASSLNQSAAAASIISANNDSKLRQSKQTMKQSSTTDNNQNKYSHLQASTSSQQQQQPIKESTLSQNTRINASQPYQFNNPSSNIQHQVLDHEDFQQFSIHKEFFNQTSDLSKQNQYSQVKQPMKSKSSAWQNNQLSNSQQSSGSAQQQCKSSATKQTQNKNPSSNLQDSQQILSYNYDELIEVCQIKDVQPIRTAQFSPYGEFFALGTNSKSIKCYSIQEIVKNYENNGPQNPIWVKKNHHEGSIYTIDWSKKVNDKQFIATGSNDMNIKVINVPTPPFDNVEKEFNTVTLSGHKGIVRTLRFHPDSSRIYSAGLPDTSIMIWDLETSSLINKLHGHTDAINSIDIDGDGNTLVSVSKDGTLRVWDLKSNKQIRSIDLSNKKYGELNYVNLNNGFNYANLKYLLSFSPNKQIKSAVNENTACVAHTNGLVTVWDLNNPQKSLYEIKNHSSDCRSVEFDPTGNYMISTSFDKSICIYNINEEKILTKISNHTDRVVLSKFHPFFPFILSTSADCTSRIFAPKDFLQKYMSQRKHDIHQQ